jgi:hypothetical protein
VKHISRSVNATGQPNPFHSPPPPAKAGGGETQTQQPPAAPPVAQLLEHGLIRPKPKPKAKTGNEKEDRARAQHASRLRLAHVCDSDRCLARYLQHDPPELWTGDAA